MARINRGIFKPKHPEKYRGNVNNIIYRSGLEFKTMTYLDNNPNVVEWASEEQIIPYYNPIKKRPARYFPDFLVKYHRKDGTIQTEIWEIKPEIQRHPPKQTPKKPRRRFLRESIVFAVNIAKWKAAENFCIERGYTFRIISEKDMGFTYGKKE